ncbi:hypothetical protein BU23DRAFT_233683 [Bimuria novae-zelandiae CBS 107.79]|uniref:Uncharacterized protein n=1 Tax=Bimuria novae-zelandiae CBS 107.79 TaxID=1447943 RepID=A0A6A5V8Y1_9PLEO|nr:hypothetical protein BU23DRAFT_233683 [Bimuria novae-zelandiae CBS 107.79]
MRYALFGLAVAAGAAASPQNNPNEVASFVPSGVLPTDTSSSDAVATSDSTSSAASGDASATDTTSGSQVTDAPIFIPPPFSTNPGAWSSIYRSIQSAGFSWPSSAYGPGFGPWGGDGPGRGPGNHPGAPDGDHWGGSSGWGPWGSNSWGPSAWASNSAWRDGPWTQWWGGSRCPGSDWPGWTQGPWSTDAPWTSWKGCTASTTATSVVTTTVSGVQTEATQFGVQVAQADGTASTAGSGSGSGSGSVGAAIPMRTVAPALAAIGGAVAIFL